VKQNATIDIPENTVVVICGPTAVGKTALSLKVAERVGGEIVSADSRQIYRYMDIGTAKPTAAERAIAPHHFIDMLNPDENYSAGEYARDARAVIADIFARGNQPVVVGGSGLYIRALLEGFFSFDAKDERLRLELKKRLATEGPESLYRELQQVDPKLAEKTHPNSTKRVMRGLEVYYLTGKPLTQIQASYRDPAPFNWVKIALEMDRKTLYTRINRRVENMFEMGLVDEVKQLQKMGYTPDLNALNTVGYKEVFAYLEGEMDLFTCKEQIKQNTRQYAKRQFTWFRGENDVKWLSIDPNAALENQFSAFVELVN
jgi:tRNA dimethylallyltransferase